MHYWPLLAQRAIVSTLCGLLLTGLAPSAVAEPYQPQSDQEIVQTIPDYIASQAAALTLEASTALASSLLAQAKDNSDPRAVSVALQTLKPWAHTQSAELNIIRAGLLQYQHNFGAAIKQLEHPIKSRSPDPRALLLRANIHIVQGRYADAERDCSALLRHSDTAVSATCLAVTHSLSGQLAKSYTALNSFAQRFTNSQTTVKQWIASSLADMAIRLGHNPSAHWQAAFQEHSNNASLRLEQARWLISRNQLKTAQALLLELPTSLNRDVLLARTSISPPVEQLQSRFELAEVADGKHAHAREYTEFLLHVAKRPKEAAVKALLNWQQQREPIDLLLLSIAAQRSGNQAARMVASEFRQQTHIEDIRLPTIEGKL